MTIEEAKAAIESLRKFRNDVEATGVAIGVFVIKTRQRAEAVANELAALHTHCGELTKHRQEIARVARVIGQKLQRADEAVDRLERGFD